MKKKKTNKVESEETDEMLPEYDFSGGVRGKHHKAHREGNLVSVRKYDGTVQVLHFSLEEGAIMLEPDVRKYFHDSDAVNEALRG